VAVYGVKFILWATPNNEDKLTKINKNVSELDINLA